MSLVVQDFSVSYSLHGSQVRAVNNVSFTIEAGERVGLVGESGCGKTALMTALLGLDPAQRVEGSALFRGVPPASLRGKEIGMIFQDPMTSLNPTMKVGAQIAEGLIYHGTAPSVARQRALELLQLVGIPDPLFRSGQYPHALSGGQRQRVLIAIALACNPTLLFADEPTTALDPSVASQVLHLLQELTAEFNTALLLVTHDLRIVASICHRVVVMHEGNIVEDGPVEQIFYEPRHAYTKSLLHSLPAAIV